MNLIRRQLLLTLAGLSALPLLTACEPAKKTPLTIASHVWPGYELMFLARQEGWLSVSGLKLNETTSATASLNALVAGQVDGAALTLDEVLRARAQGIQLSIVLVFDISAGADVVLATSEIQKLADLAGKRIGVEQTALGALILHKLLTRAELPLSAITQVPITADGHQRTWHNKQLDVIITYEPISTRLEAEGARRIFDSRDIFDTILDVLAVKPDAIKQKKDALDALVAAHFKARKQFYLNPQDASYRMSRRLNLSADDVLNAYRGLKLPDVYANHKLLSDGKLLTAAKTLSQIMVQAGLLSKNDSLVDLVYSGCLPVNS
ncbi:MAG: ABC transporter substrate-binding protein [Gammaproteobacteria bacterium]|nr:ABC transporter substrate-binding protein [Gammaproteobacteria bacterium]